MEIQKAMDSQSRSKQKEHGQGYYITWLKTVLRSHSDKDSVVQHRAK